MLNTLRAASGEKRWEEPGSGFSLQKGKKEEKKSAEHSPWLQSPRCIFVWWSPALAHVENPILHGAPAEWPREMGDEERVSESDCDNRNSFFCNPKAAGTSSRDLWHLDRARPAGHLPRYSRGYASSFTTFTLRYQRRVHLRERKYPVVPFVTRFRFGVFIELQGPTSLVSAAEMPRRYIRKSHERSVVLWYKFPEFTATETVFRRVARALRR